MFSIGRISILTYCAVCLCLFTSLTFAEASSALIPSIPYTKVKLDNGLTVIIHEDHSSPVAFVEVTYRVGSAKEEPGKTGFAHFFEHMMFSGSEHVQNGEHFKRITVAGGRLNGTTGRDVTRYYQTLPSNQVETALWLESDRMGYLLGNVTKEAFEIQRSTVKNEKAQHYDNQPYGLIYETLAKNLYPNWHPYSWIPIGVVEDLDRVTVEDLKQFFLKWYSPNNAILTVSGDVSPNQILALANKYFGNLPNGAKPGLTLFPQPQLAQNAYVTLEDETIRQPKLTLNWIGTPTFHKDEPALDAVAFILGKGITAKLYQALIKTEKVFAVEANHSTGELSGEFEIEVTGYPKQSLAEIKKDVDKVLKNFEKQMTQEDLLRFKSSIVSSTLFQLDNVEEKGRQLAYSEVLSNNPNQTLIQLRSYQALTLNDVKKAFRKYISSKPYLALSTVVKNETHLQAAKPQAPKWIGLNKPLIEKKMVIRKYEPPIDNFDRSIPPKIGESEIPTLPPFWTATLNNGLKIIGFTVPDLPFAKLEIEMPAGQFYVPKEISGVAQLSAQLMNLGTTYRSAEAFNNELDKLGASVGYSASDLSTMLSCQSLADDFPQALELLRERLLYPIFTTEEFNRYKKEQIEQLSYQLKNPPFKARVTFRRLMYGDNHPLSDMPIGSNETLTTITSDNVVQFFKTHFIPQGSFVRYVGPHDEEVVLDQLQFLKQWQNPVEFPVKSPAPKQIQPCIYVINQPNAPQSVIRMGTLAFAFDYLGNYFKASVMNFPLGEAFNSRLNLRLREDKAYTYGIGSYFSGNFIPGPFFISTSVKADHTGDAVETIINELRAFKNNGPSRAETAFTKESMLQRMALSLENSNELLDFTATIQRYNLPSDYLSQQASVLRKLTPEQIKDWANAYLPINNFVILIVGDKTKILEQLQNKDIPQKVILVE